MPGSGGGGNLQDSGHFHVGDLFMSGSHGEVLQYSSTGTFLYSYATGQNDFATGMGVDSQSNLYVTDFDNGVVTRFDSSGTVLGTFGSGSGFPGYYNPESTVFDAAGNAYVSNVSETTSGHGGITKLNAQGIYQSTILSGTRVDWMDLAADNRTLLFTQEGTAIKRVNIQTGQTMTDFVDTAANDGQGIR
jgi:hypothetical protein